MRTKGRWERVGTARRGRRMGVPEGKGKVGQERKVDRVGSKGRRMGGHEGEGEKVLAKTYFLLFLFINYRLS